GWQKLIHQADQEPYYKWQLAQRLRQLTLGAIARQHRWSRQEVRHHLSQNALGFPPEIQAYFTASRRSLGHFAARRRLLLTKRRPSPLDLAPEKIAKFLEEKFNL
ncbi:MAG: hypothetical protein R3264_20295, partial [Anaerolineae bacterium]|nr:hypothetical protein [Anaerolineae bacterium]